MLTLSIVIFITLIFPIFINLDACFIKERSKIYYKISLFYIINILNGYIELIEEGIIIHLNKFKAVIIPYKNLLGMRKKFKPLKDYHFLRFNSILELGGENDLMNSFSIGYVYNYIFQYVNWFLYHQKPYVKLNNKTIIYKDDNRLNYYCNITVILNLLMILISVIKILMEKILYAIRNKTKQNKQRN